MKTRAAAQPSSRVPAPPAWHLLRARDLIDARYYEPLDVAALARSAHASQAHFARSFKRAFGETPHQYLLTRRMERAKHLLRESGMSVTEVSLEVGFRSLGSFSATFKRIVGTTPREFRRRMPAAGIPTCYLMAWDRPRGRAALEKNRNGNSG
jgi:AraC-like DNA-binding protein